MMAPDIRPQYLLRRLLIERRQRAGLTQQQVAERVGRLRGSFQGRAGLHWVTVVELIELAAALDFDPAAALRRLAKAAKR
jgi:transcriptional regulator with XRE-family HTH domain